jgi:hypothetical protein
MTLDYSNKERRRSDESVVNITRVPAVATWRNTRAIVVRGQLPRMGAR